MRQIIHMDMKSANILLARDMTAKIAVRWHAHTVRHFLTRKVAWLLS